MTDRSKIEWCDATWNTGIDRGGVTQHSRRDAATTVRLRRVGKVRAGRVFDGRTWEEVPDAAR